MQIFIDQPGCGTHGSEGLRWQPVGLEGLFHVTQLFAVPSRYPVGKKGTHGGSPSHPGTVPHCPHKHVLTGGFKQRLGIASDGNEAAIDIFKRHLRELREAPVKGPRLSL